MADRRRLDRIEVVSIDDGEVVLYWDLPAKQARRSCSSCCARTSSTSTPTSSSPHGAAWTWRTCLSTAGAKGETSDRGADRRPSARSRAAAAEARATVPDLELGAEVDMAACLALSAAHGWPLTAMLARACALALRAVPRANGAYRDGRYELYSRVNVGIVLATEEAYLIPTVFDADHKRLPELSAEVEQLTVAALAGELSPPAFSGATFTLSHPGERGVASRRSVVNAPQAAALAAGSIRRVPASVTGQRPGVVMTVTLACDHRILYGAHAARFLREICSRLSEGKLLKRADLPDVNGAEQRRHQWPQS